MANDAVYLANTSYSIDLEASSTQYLSRGDSAPLDITGNLTMECYIRLETAPASGSDYVILGKWNSTGNQRSYIMSLFNDAGTHKIRFSTSSDGIANSSNTVTPSANFSLNTWYHIAVLYTASSGQFELTVNGVSKGTGGSLATSLFNGTAEFRIGARGDGAEYFDGMIDDVRVWNATRMVAQILANYQVELVGNETNLQAYWKLNNALTDSTANGLTLTNNGSAIFSNITPLSIADDEFVKKASASAANTADSFIGFAESAISNGTSGFIIIAGAASGFSGLHPGNLFYLSDTTGAVDVSPGTVTRKVGIAIATDKILITNNW